MEAFITYRQPVPLPDAIRGRPADMAVGDVARIAAVAARAGLDELPLTGNESTHHPEFPALVATVLKRGCTPVVETAGFIPEPAMDAILTHQLPVDVRLYPPGTFTEEHVRTTDQTLHAIAHTVPDALRLICILDRQDQDLEYVLDAAERYHAAAVLFRLAAPWTRRDVRPLGERVADTAIRLADREVHVSLGCTLPLCSFPDAEFGRLAKAGVEHDTCTPRLCVLPDRTVTYCRHADRRQGLDLTRHRRRKPFAEWLARRYADLQIDMRLHPDCAACRSHRAGLCHGPCLGIKAEQLREELARRQAAAQPDPNADTLTDIGVLQWELGELEAARISLEQALACDEDRPEIHLLLGRVLFALDETETAERAFAAVAERVPDPRAILLELAQRLRDAGQRSRAQRLEAEVRRTPPPEPDEDPVPLG